MKVLYLIDNFSLGGAQTVVKGLMEKNRSNMQVYAIALREKSPKTIIDHPNAECYNSKSKYSFRPLGYLESFILKNQIEIIHCQLPRSIFFGYLLKRKLPYLKYLIHEQGDVFESWIYSILLRIFKSKADGIFACSKATKDTLSIRSKIAAHKITVLYNFVDLARFSPGKGDVGNVVKIGFAGRIEKRKGWREFIRAAKYFQDNKNLFFYIAGSGSEEGKLLRILRNEDYSNIKFLGFKANVEEFFHLIDLLVIPSHFEPMGMVAIEAMACRVPVLASDVPGLNEIVEHEINGWTYPSKSIHALTDAIFDIINYEPGRKKNIIDGGFEQAQKFSIEKYWNTLQNLYASVLSEK